MAVDGKTVVAVHGDADVVTATNVFAKLRGAAVVGVSSDIFGFAGFACLFAEFSRPRLIVDQRCDCHREIRCGDCRFTAFCPHHHSHSGEEVPHPRPALRRSDDVQPAIAQRRRHQ